MFIFKKNKVMKDVKQVQKVLQLARQLDLEILKLKANQDVDLITKEEYESLRKMGHQLYAVSLYTERKRAKKNNS